MAEGFLQSGFIIPYASDKSEQAALTYRNRHEQLGFETKFHCGDITDLAKPEKLRDFLGEDINKIDVICGGPPCQGFSLAGKRNPSDLRNQLVHSYIRILSQVKPKYFVMENVLGILSAKFLNYQGISSISYINQKVIDVLLSEFKEIGYPDVQVKLMDASDYGVPQKRQRVIFLGTRSDVLVRLGHPQPTTTNKVSARDAISDLSQINLGTHELKYTSEPQTEYQKASRLGRTANAAGLSVKATQLHNHQTSRHNGLVTERFTLLNNGETIKKMLERLDLADSVRLATKKQSCRKIVAEQPSPTVLTLPDDLIHYSKNRILTVREMARLQSFDDSFEFMGKRTTGGDRRKQETPQYTLVGNAVPPLLAKAIADEIMKNINVERCRESTREAAL